MTKFKHTSQKQHVNGRLEFSNINEQLKQGCVISRDITTVAINDKIERMEILES